MRNLVMMTMVCACAVLTLADNVMASGGGGKQSRARIAFQNVEPAGGASYAVLVLAENEDPPSTVGELKSRAIFVGPQQTRRTNRLKKGEYTAVLIPVAAFQDVPDSTNIEGQQPADTQSVTLNGSDITLRIANGQFAS